MAQQQGQNYQGIPICDTRRAEFEFRLRRHKRHGIQTKRDCSLRQLIASAEF